jgi:hypothetical protein
VTSIVAVQPGAVKTFQRGAQPYRLGVMPVTTRADSAPGRYPAHTTRTTPARS